MGYGGVRITSSQLLGQGLGDGAAEVAAEAAAEVAGAGAAGAAAADELMVAAAAVVAAVMEAAVRALGAAASKGGTEPHSGVPGDANGRQGTMREHRRRLWGQPRGTPTLGA